jgi:hypothetical protein
MSTQFPEIEPGEGGRSYTGLMMFGMANAEYERFQRELLAVPKNG